MCFYANWLQFMVKFHVVFLQHFIQYFNSIFYAVRRRVHRSNKPVLNFRHYHAKNKKGVSLSIIPKIFIIVLMKWVVQRSNNFIHTLYVTNPWVQECIYIKDSSYNISMIFLHWVLIFFYSIARRLAIINLQKFLGSGHLHLLNKVLRL